MRISPSCHRNQIGNVCGWPSGLTVVSQPSVSASSRASARASRSDPVSKTTGNLRGVGGRVWGGVQAGEGAVPGTGTGAGACDSRRACVARTDLVQEGERPRVPLEGDAHEVAHGGLDLGLDGPASRSAAMASMSRRWYALSSLSASSDRPVRPAGGPGQRSHTTPPSGGTQRNDSVASSIRSHSTHRSTSGRWPELVREVHLVPARDPVGRHPGVEQLVGAVEQVVQRLGRVALLEAPVRELGDVPRGRGALERSRRPQPGVARRGPR